MPHWSCSGLNYALFEEFVHIDESVTRIIYVWRIIQHKKKSFQNELRLAYQIGRINFVLNYARFEECVHIAESVT